MGCSQIGPTRQAGLVQFRGPYPYFGTNWDQFDPEVVKRFLKIVSDEGEEESKG